MSSTNICLPRLRAQETTSALFSFNSLKPDHSVGGGEGIRTPDPRVANAVLCQLSYAPNKQNLKFQIQDSRGWLRGRDLNPRPLGYEPNELPDCSTPRQSLYTKRHRE